MRIMGTRALVYLCCFGHCLAEHLDFEVTERGVEGDRLCT